MVSDHVAGDPMNEKIKWLKLTQAEIRRALKKYGIKVSRNIIRKLLKKHGFVKRKMQKKKSTCEFKNRDKQFKQINKLKKEFMKSNNPILSIDTKKKENLGNLYREGKVYCTEAQEVYDHDYKHLSTGTLIPHGVYDLKRNEALINLAAGKETAEFICDSIQKWWNRIGKKYYTNATEILIFCDSGGANSYRHNIFKVELQKLTNNIGLAIRICHYPPYASKWNPIEHKVFPHISRSMAGVKLETIDDAKALIENTKTTKGLNVIVNAAKKIYESGETAMKNALEEINLIRHKVLGELNYTVAPMVL